MSNLVIVAIPDENDRVWKVSSEQVPHMTLLFLGDADEVDNLDMIMQFVEHAATTTLNKFYLPVDRRGELGDDPELGPADVLFFKKNRYDYKAIRDFRASLLQDNNIKTAYDSAAQFDGPWVPHLTLGYEKQPAKPQTGSDDYPFYVVDFNKIAVWTDNYSGPEFLLKDFWDEFDALESVPMDVAMSDLAHYGVKGMRWGRTKGLVGVGGANPSGEGETKREGIQRYIDPQGHKLSTDAIKTGIGAFVPIVAPLTWPAQIRLTRAGVRGIQGKVLDNQEKKFAENAMSPHNFAAIHNGSVEKVNSGIDSINKQYPNPNKSSATRKKYDAEVLKMMQDAYQSSANQLGNKHGTQHLELEFKNDGLDFKIHARPGMQTPTVEPAKHAATDDATDAPITVEITGKLKRDAMGHVVGVSLDGFDSAPMTHSDIVDTGAAFLLEHYGVKGMHWGQRKENAVTTQTHVDSGLIRRRTKVRAEGGESQDAHPDAVKAAVAKQTIKKSGTDALSTQELRDLANRLQVENQVAILTSSKGRKFVNQQLENEGKNVLRTGAKASLRRTAPHVAKKAKKAAATAAVSALI